MSQVSSTNASRASTSTFTTALVFNTIVLVVELIIFTIIRRRFKSIYEPRTYVPILAKRAQPLSAGILGWPIAIFKADHAAVIPANGVDAYFFVRFLRMIAKIFLPIWIISWAVLMPITSVRTNVAPNKGLDKFVFGNVAKNKQNRYWAHLACIWVFTLWILYNLWVEMRHFIKMRQLYLVDPMHAGSVQANTILVTGIPARSLTLNSIRDSFRDLPGGIRRIWINRDLKNLPDVYDRRLKACDKLEAAEANLLRTAHKLHLKGINSKGNKSNSGVAHNVDVERNYTSAVPANKRPRHRLGSIPLIGRKVDTIEWARQEIRVCNELLDRGRWDMDRGDEDTTGGANGFAMNDYSNEEFQDKQNGVTRVTTRHDGGKEMGTDRGNKDKNTNGREYPALNSAFVTFGHPTTARKALDVLHNHETYRASGIHPEISPEDVIWGNLGLNPYAVKMRKLIGRLLTAALIIFWAIPVAFVGIVSNIYSLSHTYKWLSWLQNLNGVVLGIISGILPAILLAILMMLLPKILRRIARFEGIPQKTGVELSLMTRFFIFQVIHTFLIVTVSSGIIAALPGLVKKPTGVPSLLAQNLPQASTFFLTYLLLQGFSGTGGGFLQAVPLIIYYAKLFILGSTPRSVYNIKFSPRSVAWGTTFPTMTVLVVIALGYSVISPIINGFTCVIFFAFYQLYKYLFLWQYQQSPAMSDTGGLFFPRAIQHVFVGLYVQQICLCALFFLAENTRGKRSAPGQGALTAALLILTALFHMYLNRHFKPLIHALPSEMPYHRDTSGATLDRESTNQTRFGPMNSIDKPNAYRVADSQRPGAIDVVHREDEVSGRGTAGYDATGGHSMVGGPNAVGGVQGGMRLISEEEYGFAHPAASRPQRVVWLPRDAMLLAEEESRGCRDAGVDVSMNGAQMNEKGKVDISGAPPGMFLQE